MGYKINYTGVDKSDALEHWKYIKREKVGGKWRYWYESPSGKVIGHKPTVTEKVSKDAEYAINRIKDYANSTESEREKDSKLPLPSKCILFLLKQRNGQKINEERKRLARKKNCLLLFHHLHAVHDREFCNHTDVFCLRCEFLVS